MFVEAAPAQFNPDGFIIASKSIVVEVNEVTVNPYTAILFKLRLT